VRKRRELDLLPLLIAPVDLGEEVIDRARQTIEATVYPEPLYNLACCESLTGRTSDAIAHLRLALDRTERYRDRLRWLAAKYDSDFDPIRDARVPEADRFRPPGSLSSEGACGSEPVKTTR
jgi:hypothetical protein